LGGVGRGEGNALHVRGGAGDRRIETGETVRDASKIRKFIRQLKKYN